MIKIQSKIKQGNYQDGLYKDTDIILIAMTDSMTDKGNLAILMLSYDPPCLLA